MSYYLPLVGLIVGASGLVFIIAKYRKQAAFKSLVSLPEAASGGQLIKQALAGKKLDFNFWLQRLLSRLKLFLLKSERYLEHWRQSLKKNSQQQTATTTNNDAFWEQLKSTKHTDQGNPPGPKAG